MLTLSLAIGLGSRDLVSRSLESHVERSSDRNLKALRLPPVHPVRLCVIFEGALLCLALQTTLTES